MEYKYIQCIFTYCVQEHTEKQKAGNFIVAVDSIIDSSISEIVSAEMNQRKRKYEAEQREFPKRIKKYKIRMRLGLTWDESLLREGKVEEVSNFIDRD